MDIANKRDREAGLTLIELLAVVVILGIIAGIAVISISQLIQTSKTKAFLANAYTLRDAAHFYLKEKLVREEEYDGEISYKLLLENGYIEPIKDPDTGELLEPSDESFVEVKNGKLYAVMLIGVERMLSKKSDRAASPVPLDELSADDIVTKN
ncbi:type II secretion system protein [Peribacillus deserti]|nr:prepilin-type N-terminal cleavage/methylation domain-containing protein [Peribacillus deserti]